MKNNLYPDKCPITGLPFFMEIEHPQKGMVPTYGGPYDSYTIPEMEDSDSPIYERELIRERFDHDAGCWKNEFEILDLKICPEEYLIKIESQRDNLLDSVKPVIQEVLNRHGVIDDTWNDGCHLEITITVKEAKTMINAVKKAKD